MNWEQNSCQFCNGLEKHLEEKEKEIAQLKEHYEHVTIMLRESENRWATLKAWTIEQYKSLLPWKPSDDSDDRGMLSMIETMKGKMETLERETN